MSNAMWSGDLWRSKIGWSKILARDAKLPHHRVQRRPGESEAGCGLADHSTSLTQHMDDMLPLHVRQSGVPAGLQGDWPYFGQRSTEIRATRKDDRPFNEVLELPYIPRPRPAHQGLHRVR